MNFISVNKSGAKKILGGLLKNIASFKYGDKKLLLRCGSNWDDSYFSNILLPFLDEMVPSNAEQVRSSQYTRAWKVYTNRDALFLKFFLFRGIKDKLLFFRKSRAKRDMEGGELLRQKGFNVPLLIAQGEIRKGFRIISNFLITEWVESVNVYVYLKTFLNAPFSDKDLNRKRDFIKAFGAVIGRLHRNGIFHGDLRAGNILIVKKNDEPFFFFIDNERNKYFASGIPMRLRLKNLVQTRFIVTPYMTSTDRMRFLKAYLDENPGLKPKAKELIETIHKKTLKRLKK